MNEENKEPRKTVEPATLAAAAGSSMIPFSALLDMYEKDVRNHYLEKEKDLDASNWKKSVNHKGKLEPYFDYTDEAKVKYQNLKNEYEEAIGSIERGSRSIRYGLPLFAGLGMLGTAYNQYKNEQEGINSSEDEKLVTPLAIASAAQPATMGLDVLLNRFGNKLPESIYSGAQLAKASLPFIGVGALGLALKRYLSRPEETPKLASLIKLGDSYSRSQDSGGKAHGSIKKPDQAIFPKSVLYGLQDDYGSLNDAYNHYRKWFLGDVLAPPAIGGLGYLLHRFGPKSVTQYTTPVSLGILNAAAQPTILLPYMMNALVDYEIQKGLLPVKDKKLIKAPKPGRGYIMVGPDEDLDEAIHQYLIDLEQSKEKQKTRVTNQVEDVKQIRQEMYGD